MSPDSLNDQQTYHRALKFHAQEVNFEIIKGYYSVNQIRAFKVDGNNLNKHPNECEYVNVWKLEEKQTDVNIAVESLFDVMTDDNLEQVVFVTNDTDLSSALEKIQSLNKVKVGLVIPTMDSIRKPNEKLDKFADWTRKNILEEELKASQLPRIVQGGRKAATKPVGWLGQPEILERIFELLLTVEPNRNKCWRWLEKKPPQFGDLPALEDLPIKMLDNEDLAKNVLLYAERYVELFKQK